MSKKLEIILASLIIVLTIGFVGFKLSSNLISKDKNLEKIANAINTNDIDYLLSMTEIEGHDEPLSVEDLGVILPLIAGESINANSLSATINNTSKNYYLKPDGKEKLIYNKYILVVKPYNISINSNFVKSQVFLDDTLLGSIDENEYSLEANNIRPGAHTVKIVYEGEFGEISTEEEIVVFSLSDNKINYNIELEAYSTHVHSNMDKARLYINDKDSGIILNDYKEIGPFPIDDEITLQAKVIIDGRTYESGVYKLADYNSYDLFLDIDYTEPEPEPEPIDISQDARELIQQHIWEYQHRLVDAINQGNYSLVSPYIKSNSPLEKAQQALVENLYDKGTTEEFVSYSFYDFYQISPYEFEVDVGERHEIYYDNGDAKTVDNRWIYSVTYDGYKVELTNLRSKE